MATEDKIRWEKKYQTQPIPTKVVEILKTYAPLALGNRALDIACGMGRNSRYLASQGFEVDALDISPTALSQLEGIKGIHTQEVDLDTHEFLENHYDLIVCTYFLKREIFPKIARALKKGGILIFETFVYHPDNEKAPSNRSFLLEQGELKATFGEDYEIIHLREFWDRGICGERLMRGSFVGRYLGKA